MLLVKLTFKIENLAKKFKLVQTLSKWLLNNYSEIMLENLLGWQYQGAFKAFEENQLTLEQYKVRDTDYQCI